MVQANPHILQEHQGEFLCLINEPAEGGESNILSQLAATMHQTQALTVTPEEREAIEWVVLRIIAAACSELLVSIRKAALMVLSETYEEYLQAIGRSSFSSRCLPSASVGTTSDRAGVADK